MFIHGNTAFSRRPKYGRDAFTYRVVEDCDKKALESREVHWIAELHTFIGDPVGWGYNMTSGGDTGYVISESTKEKIRLAKRGRKASIETRRKMSENKKGAYIGSNNPFFGRHHSEETKAALSCSRRGKRPTKEQIQKQATRRAKEYCIISPTGEVFRVKGLTEFARNHHLYCNILTRVAKGKTNHHKGYRCYYLDRDGNPIIPPPRKAHPTGEWVEICEPSGKTIRAANLKEYCRANDLVYSTMRKVLYRERRHHKGYTCRYSPTPAKSYLLEDSNLTSSIPT